MKPKQFKDGIINSEVSDKDYWKQYEHTFDEEGYVSGMSHDINIEVAVKYSNLNGLLYETKEKCINCNVKDLNTFFENLKKTIRMVDETLDEKEPF